MMDGLAPKDATADESVKAMHTLVMYDRRREICEA